ncbi:MAG TPA: PilZ domain-containing protein [Nitrospiraceae bacterium]|nr:PilZ domain-containing protein [Nitrospiraceae bacterium]
MDRRQSPRFRVHFQGSFTIEREDPVAGEGTVVDLSLGGCRVESELRVPTRIDLELLIYVPDVEEPIRIGWAPVQWARDHDFGVKFARVAPDQQKRLRRVLQTLEPTRRDA